MEERDRLEAEKRQEMERLKKESELELQAASKKLEELKESAQKEMEKEKQKLRSEVRVTHCIFSDFTQLVLDSFMKKCTESSDLLFPACLNADEKRWINNQNPDIRSC